MKYLVVTLIFLPAILFGTAQIPDRIVIDGEEHALYAEPLESYPWKENERPKVFSEGSISSANWRGYVATWKIEDGSLMLTNIQKEYWDGSEGRETKYKDIPIERVFPSKQLPIDAKWFDGRIRIPKGEMVSYVHMGYGSRFEKEIIYEIENGRVMKRTEITYDPTKDKYRSHSDMEWVALGADNEIEEVDDWIDGRLIPTSYFRPTIEAEGNVKTRGIFTTHESIYYIWIPETQMTEREYLPFHKAPDSISTVSKGSHIEIEGTFVKSEDGFDLHVSKFRNLEPGGNHAFGILHLDLGRLAREGITGPNVMNIVTTASLPEHDIIVHIETQIQPVGASN